MVEAIDSLASKQASKQAFLIIAHKVDIVFHTLIQMLDHPKNDIFIHMDAKNTSYNPSETLKLVMHSKVFHTPRIQVSWGGYSQIEAELILLETATSQRGYEHYHLLSGADLPIKKQNEISTFFERNHGLEFIDFQNEKFEYENRTRFYYPLQDIIGRRKNTPLYVLSKILLIIQKILHIRRNKREKFQKGTNWFSITDNFARYVLSKREWIRTTFHDTVCCDEVFLHTLLINSPFRNNLYRKEFDNNQVKSIMRLIDWKRGSPYIFRLSDLEEIKNSAAMFARKFDENVDAEIVRKIKELYS